MSYDERKYNGTIPRPDRNNDIPRPSRFDEECDKAQPRECSRPMTSEEYIDKIFTYQPPTQTTLPKFLAIREAGKYFAKVLLFNMPAGGDRYTAIQKIREAVMVANAGVSLDGMTQL